MRTQTISSKEDGVTQGVNTTDDVKFPRNRTRQSILDMVNPKSYMLKPLKQ